MDYYTSITSNYLPKARVLAASVKRHDPDARFHLLLSDVPPPGFDLAAEPFDTVLRLEDLPIGNHRGWAFGHALVEMCTAVKGIGALEIVRRHRPEKLFYFDPDIVVFGSLQALGAELDRNSVLLTPHLTDPERSRAGILDNEISALKHGIYNLGFIGVRCEGEGLRCLQWWSDRLLDFCRDDIPNGLFTDQRWADLIPAMFDDVRVLREPEYNVATWNLSNRTASGSAPDALTINGRPLGFYHFSGFDSGAQEAMLKAYGGESPVLFELRQWYIEQCRLNGQETLGRLPCVYARFDNGEPITKMQRILYRERADLREAFPDPFATADPARSYFHWFQANSAAEIEAGRVPPEAFDQRMAAAERELALIKRSRSWRLARAIARIASVAR
ncbi:MAG TPA: glycosyl transferase [Quisquiliibacterium sp.]|nr:glycosyl transferase [Quisquiliibacterium sp.]